MINLIKDSNYEKFKSETPSSVSAEFFNLQKEIGKHINVNEANQDTRFIEPGVNDDQSEDIV